MHRLSLIHIWQLPPMQVGQYGQLQEWFEDWDNPNDHHRQDVYKRQTEDIILLSYPKLKEVPFTKPCTFIHEDEYGCILVNPVEGELYFYDPMTRSLEQAYVYEKGVRVPISFQEMCIRDRYWFYQCG